MRMSLLSLLSVVLLSVVLLASGCASDTPAASTGPTCPGELQVKINEGVMFDACRVINAETSPKVSQQTADLLIYKNKGGFDFWSGSNDIGTLPLKKMTANTGGQIANIYTSLAEVPSRKPLANSSQDAQGRFFNVGTGHGAVVQNNVSKGWTKIWVKQAISASELLVIQFETF